MQALRSRPGVRRGGILYLRADELSPNPVQPRRRFDDEALAELSESIKTYGILNPLTVRLRGGKYELVAGERRLAGKLRAVHGGKGPLQYGQLDPVARRGYPAPLACGDGEIFRAA